MRWLKKWAYLILFLGAGAGYFACVDHWQVYADSMNKLKGWYQEVTGDDFRASAGDEVQAFRPEGDPDTEGMKNLSESGNKEAGEREAGINVSGGNQGKNPPGDKEKESEGSLTDAQTENQEKDPEGNGGKAPAGSEGNDPGESGGNASAGSEGNDPGESGGNASAGNQGNDPGESGGKAPAGSEGNGPADSGENSTQGNTVSGDVEYMTVEDDYFSDALFIGDSRTVGMYEYGGLEEVADFYASKGLTIYKMFDSQIVSAPGGKITVEEGLQQNTFSKIYLMIGINEMGTGTVETFLEKYKETVEHLQELQPDALIYLQGIIKVTADRSAKGDYINNEGIEARNQGIALLADNEKVFYLDVNPLICDESGGMNPAYTFDGVHLMGKYIEIWKDYLKTHAISP